MHISNGFAFLYCRGWTYAKGVRNPNGILGVLIRQNFPAPENTIIDGVECDTRADMVVNGFWAISLS